MRSWASLHPAQHHNQHAAFVSMALQNIRYAIKTEPKRFDLGPPSFHYFFTLHPCNQNWILVILLMLLHFFRDYIQKQRFHCQPTFERIFHLWRIFLLVITHRHLARLWYNFWIYKRMRVTLFREQYLQTVDEPINRYKINNLLITLSIKLIFHENIMGFLYLWLFMPVWRYG